MDTTTGHPPRFRACVGILADYAVELRPDLSPDDQERLRAWVAGAVEAQVTDPDLEQAAEVIMLDPR